MPTYDVAIVGTGPDPENPSTEGFAMGYRHAESFENQSLCDVVACADVVEENAVAFADAFDLPDEGVFTDHVEMLDAVDPDIVGVAVPPTVHEDIVVDCADHGVAAVHCEKPMAHTLESARRMAEACEDAGVQLTFNRQRRFGKPYRRAKELVDEGEIGDLERIETGWGDLFDIGAHTVDLTGMLNDEHRAEWVIAQLDYREEDVRFGMHQENQVWALWEYENGVQGVLSTGEGDGLVGAAHRIVGTEGEIRIDSDTGNMLELRRAGDAEWEAVDVDGENLHTAGVGDNQYGSRYIDRAIDEIVTALDEGRPSELRAENGLKTAEIIYGGYESVRKRGRVEFPVEIDDNPLEAMVEAGELTPEPADEE